MMTDQPTGFAESGYDPAEDTPTATERVSRLLQDLGLSEMPAAFAARTLRDAPDLLIDLAIEVGGLEQFDECAHCAGRESCRYDLSDIAFGGADECTPAYRRTSTEGPS